MKGRLSRVIQVIGILLGLRLDEVVLMKVTENFHA